MLALCVPRFGPLSRTYCVEFRSLALRAAVGSPAEWGSLVGTLSLQLNFFISIAYIVNCIINSVPGRRLMCAAKVAQCVVVPMCLCLRFVGRCGGVFSVACLWTVAGCNGDRMQSELHLNL